MEVTTDAFRFTLAPASQVFRDGDRLIALGIDDSQLIVTSTRIAGTGTGDSQGIALLDQLLENAVSAMRSALTTPELLVTKPFHKGRSAGGLAYVAVTAVTADHGVLFEQVAFSSACGVILVSFEGPNTESAASYFKDFVDSVKTSN